jgi:hypothetical protein
LTSQLTSTTVGLGSLGYISSASLGGLVSTPNLLNLVSTSYLGTQVASTVTGLGTAGYISTLLPAEYSFFTVREGTSYTGEAWGTQLMSLSNLGDQAPPIYLESNNIVLRVSTTGTQGFRVSYMTGGNDFTLTTPRPTITMAVSTPTTVKYYPSVENFEGGGGSISFLEEFDDTARILFYMRGLSNYTFTSQDSTLYRMSFETIKTSSGTGSGTTNSESTITTSLFTQHLRVVSTSLVGFGSISMSNNMIQSPTISSQAVYSGAFYMGLFFA